MRYHGGNRTHAVYGWSSAPKTRTWNVSGTESQNGAMMTPVQDSVSARFRELRKRAGLSRPALAKALGYKHASGIQRYEQDGARSRDYIPPEILERLVKAVVGKGDPPITLGEVMVLGAPSSLSLLETGVVWVPFVSWSSAGHFASQEAITSLEDVERIAVPGDSADGLIALRVSGESMNRIAPSGSTIVVNTLDRELREGRRYIFICDGETTFKTYRANPARFEPESTLPHDTIFPSGRVEVVGRVIKVLTDL